MRRVGDYTVGIVIGNDIEGSGTLIEMGGKKGILTAWHVAEPMFGAPEDSLALIVDTSLRRFRIRRDLLRHTVIGSPASPDDNSGPDLSFVEFLEPSIMHDISTAKTFSVLDGNSVGRFETFSKQMWWFYSGFPCQSVQPDEIKATGEPYKRVSNFVGQAAFSRIVRDAGFDYVHLDSPAGLYNFPPDFHGVSGGGIWLVPVEMDPDQGPQTAIVHDFFLAGVVCWQHRPSDGQRGLSGHGPQSIYERLRSSLSK